MNQKSDNQSRPPFELSKYWKCQACGQLNSHPVECAFCHTWDESRAMHQMAEVVTELAALPEPPKAVGHVQENGEIHVEIDVEAYLKHGEELDRIFDKYFPDLMTP